MTRVTKDQWKRLPPPERYTELALDLSFSAAEAEKLLEGHRPGSMDDRWFIYEEDGWLYIHRSWSGALIFWLEIEGVPGGARVRRAYVSRDPDQYRGTEPAEERAWCSYLLRAVLLGQDVELPRSS